MKRTVLVLLFLSLAGSLISFGSREAKETVTFSGNLKVQGNEPFIFLALTTDEGKTYAIEGEKTDALTALQGKGTITVRGRILDTETPFGVDAVIEVTSFSSTN